jgi:hypothetical protein
MTFRVSAENEFFGNGETRMIWSHSIDNSNDIVYHGNANRGRYGFDFAAVDGDAGDGSGSGELLCEASALPDYSCQLVLSGTAKLHWTTAPDLLSAAFALESSTSGWAAVGFTRSGGMVDSDLIIGFVDGGTSSVAPYLSTAYAVPNMDPSRTLTDVSIEIVGGISTMKFTTVLPAEAQVGDTRMIWAHSPDNSPSLGYHAQFKVSSGSRWHAGVGM